jgi:hypothetical protein
MNLRTIDNTMTKRKRTKGQPMTYKTLHIDRLSSMYPTINPEMKSGAPEELAIPAPLVTPVITL